MSTTHITFDTGAGVNLIRQKQLPLDWESYKLEDAQLPALGDANGNRLPILGAVSLRVRLGKYVYRSTFYLAPRLAVPAILGTAFMNRHVVAIRCIDQRIQFLDGPLVPILAHGNSQSPTPSPSDMDRD